MTVETDPFDDLLGLEERFYDEGFQLGTADGEAIGKMEGRVFGLEKGFEKYLEMGRLHGRSLVWISRSPEIKTSNAKNPPSATKSEKGPSSTVAKLSSENILCLPNLPASSRLTKHLRILYGLTEPASLSTENSEDAVSDFDDRLKRAIGRVKMIERIVGEEVVLRGTGKPLDGRSSNQHTANNGREANIEDVAILKSRN